MKRALHFLRILENHLQLFFDRVFASFGLLFLRFFICCFCIILCILRHVHLETFFLFFFPPKKSIWHTGLDFIFPLFVRSPLLGLCFK